MATAQPEWKYAGHIGDVDPIAYGGVFVYTDASGVYPPELTYFDPAPDEQWQETKGKTPLTIYRVSLDRCDIMRDSSTPNGEYLIPHGFSTRTDLPHPILSYREWFDSWDEPPSRTTCKLADVADTMNIHVSELRQMFCVENPMVRARAYQTIAEYYGWENLDSYPITMTEDEAYAKYAEEIKAWQQAKR